jgi:hypothetical protein
MESQALSAYRPSFQTECRPFTRIFVTRTPHCRMAYLRLRLAFCQSNC